MALLHRVELVIVDGEEHGINEVIHMLNDASDRLLVHVTSTESKQMEWDDDNPLNMNSITPSEVNAEFDKYE